MGSRRIFIAVDIPEEARTLVTEYVDHLRSRFPGVRVGWERTEKLHFTLKFLGHVDDASVPEVEGSIAAIIDHHQPFTAELSGTGSFPDAREPRILWLGMAQGREEMIALGTDIEAAVENLGFLKDGRAFSPHLTIGRIREPKRGRELADAHLHSVFDPVGFEVNWVTIYESILGPQGSRYDVVSRHRLQ